MSARDRPGPEAGTGSPTARPRSCGRTRALRAEADAEGARGDRFGNGPKAQRGRDCGTRVGGETARRPSHRRMGGRWYRGMGGLVLPSGVTRIQRHVLADIQGREESQQQKQRQGDGVRMPACAVNAHAPQREGGRENQRNERFARHHGHRHASLSRHCAPASLPRPVRRYTEWTSERG